MKKNKVVRVLMLLCVILQGVAVTPHHHHIDRPIPCFNVLHSLDYQRDMCPRAAAGEVHEHASDNASSCRLGRLIVIQPQRQDSRHGSEAAGLSGLWLGLVPGVRPCMDATVLQPEGLLVPRRSVAMPLHGAFLAGAVSPRAPSSLG